MRAVTRKSRVSTAIFIFKRSKRVAIGTLIFGGLVIFSLLGLVLDINPRTLVGDPYQPPSSQYILGTDALGRDVLAQTLQGAWYSLKIGVIAGFISTIIGVLIGGLGGYFGGWIDEFTSSLSNIIMTIPTLAILFIIASYIRIRSEWLIILLICLMSWAWTSRAVRVQVLTIKTREFIDVSKQDGLSKFRILFFEVLPNMLTYIVMSFATLVGSAIITEASLAAIGLGPSNVISLGVMLRYAISFQAAATGVWWWILPPGIIITLFSLSLLLIKDGLDEIFNPRTRK